MDDNIPLSEKIARRKQELNSIENGDQSAREKNNLDCGCCLEDEQCDESEKSQAACACESSNNHKHVEDVLIENKKLQSRNQALAQALNRAGAELEKAKSQLQQFAQTPQNFATLVRIDSVQFDKDNIQHAFAEVLFNSRRMILPISPQLKASTLVCGRSVIVNENMVVVQQRDTDILGRVAIVKEILHDGRLILVDSAGNRFVAQVAGALADVQLREGDRVTTDNTYRIALERLEDEQDDSLILEEVPNISFKDIGGLQEQIDRIRDAVQLPFEHSKLFSMYNLRAPKGVLLYGPPGNGKTLIAKAIAHELASGEASLSHEGSKPNSVFLSVKGPELLNKFVGESERLIRAIFERARKLAQAGHPVIVFIDEMDSLLRTRGSGVSSDVETTIVPQFLSELDGVEQLDNVIVIGASNRIDMIDSAVLRPGRLDVKIRVDRPQQVQARAILTHYISDEIPIDSSCNAESIINLIVQDAYKRDSSRVVARAQTDDGNWHDLYFADVVSGALLKNIADRVKTQAVKASVLQNKSVLVDSFMALQAVQSEFVETWQALRDVDARQWSKINDVFAGRLVKLVAVEG